jgi:hypothetical protein
MMCPGLSGKNTWKEENSMDLSQADKKIVRPRHELKERNAQLSEMLIDFVSYAVKECGDTTFCKKCFYRNELYGDCEFAPDVGDVDPENCLEGILRYYENKANGVEERKFEGPEDAPEWVRNHPSAILDDRDEPYDPVADYFVEKDDDYSKSQFAEDVGGY